MRRILSIQWAVLPLWLLCSGITLYPAWFQRTFHTVSPSFESKAALDKWVQADFAKNRCLVSSEEEDVHGSFFNTTGDEVGPWSASVRCNGPRVYLKLFLIIFVPGFFLNGVGLLMMSGTFDQFRYKRPKKL